MVAPMEVVIGTGRLLDGLLQVIVN
jgi:hypothetical protein